MHSSRWRLSFVLVAADGMLLMHCWCKFYRCSNLMNYVRLLGAEFWIGFFESAIAEPRLPETISACCFYSLSRMGLIFLSFLCCLTRLWDDESDKQRLVCLWLCIVLKRIDNNHRPVSDLNSVVRKNNDRTFKCNDVLLVRRIGSSLVEHLLSDFKIKNTILKSKKF